MLDVSRRPLQPDGVADCMIAATAIRAKATLATQDPVDFRRFQAAGLEIASR